ncbi:hypothetical protein [Cyanobium gracile]|uniref:Uncharacterized protein n=1 Tax=Cyanobium gracile UHCC 0281 TaxID=3110309 RepID=A0ABU5SZL7_9CYAN|nr:hypothetical protein [Cyanobium gracile]MEA5443963.1 hypothetical protein [Cyanobium gracile UHCC 0281]
MPATPRHRVHRSGCRGAYVSQSVATHGDLVVVALSPSDYGTTAGKGLVRFYRIARSGALTLLKDVEVGYLPDGIAFTDDGKKLVIAPAASASLTSRASKAGRPSPIRIWALPG